jgi:hypothetical protein
MLGGPMEIADASATMTGTRFSIILRRAQRSRQPNVQTPTNGIALSAAVTHLEIYA